ncbi:hypothetical protein [Brevundimonas sp.]|jgi:hypothetical protein|uniref:hypothetical protein n=1 Tax=Brevundimonas sp. TaxID=1871086 RepID=UPI0037C08162
MARLTPLERAVMDAMAWELRDLAPDLAGQVQESLPGLRRNTGAGLYAELIVSRHRPPPKSETQRQATGLFGTVHAMVGDLPDPVGFQVELRQGRLIALHGQSYGQDTRAIDFATTGFEEVFTLDAAGESVLYDPVALMPESPLRRLHAHDDGAHDAAGWRDFEPPPAAKPAGPPLTVLQKLQLPPTPESNAKTFGLPAESAIKSAPPPPRTPLGPVAYTWVGLYLLAALAALFLIFALRLPFVMAAVFIGWLMRWAHSKKGRPIIADFAETLRQAGVFERLNLAPGSIGKVTSDTSHSSTALNTRSRP